MQAGDVAWHVRATRVAVYIVLLLSASVSFFYGDKLWEEVRLGLLPLWVPLVAPTAFSFFVLIFIADRWLLVRRKKETWGRAFFQVGLALVFLSLVWPHQATEIREAKKTLPQDPLGRLLRYSDPLVRSSACELAALKGHTWAIPVLQRLSQKDHSARVREVCGMALAHLQSVDATLSP